VAQGGTGWHRVAKGGKGDMWAIGGGDEGADGTDNGRAHCLDLIKAYRGQL
jgi:hypothetical protein